MKTQKNEQKKRILARVMAQEISAEQLKQVAGGDSHPGTCTNGVDCDAAMV
jgi:hypothetical protein